ncbi:MAG: hypothetical protein CENE_00177 [Candidatus Celerinatantimonas neptuna]|nr:MAG: hypothetical protein CENE_00177 [Candidatus Celerinatantimonas neptuna]
MDDSESAKILFPIQIEDIEQLNFNMKTHSITFKGKLQPEDVDDVAVKLYLSEKASKQLQERLLRLYKVLGEPQ